MCWTVTRIFTKWIDLATDKTQYISFADDLNVDIQIQETKKAVLRRIVDRGQSIVFYNVYDTRRIKDTFRYLVGKIQTE